MTPLPEKLISDAALKLAQRGFASPRKKLVHNLGGHLHSKAEWQSILESLQINPNFRAEDLELPDWEDLLSLAAKDR